jgi:membrane protein implicated in regulation of membrane protease activity
VDRRVVGGHYSDTVATGENNRPTTLTALVYTFYGLGVLVIVVAALWLFGAVPGWLVPAALVAAVIVFVALWRALDRYRRTDSRSSPSEDPLG